MSIARAKFKLYEISERMTGSYKNGKWDPTPVLEKKYKFQVVTGGSPENEDFYAVSGQGVIELCTTNPDVQKSFELEAEYYTEFSRANPENDSKP